MTVKHFNNVRVWYKNFIGRQTDYFPEGARFFTLKLNAVQAQELSAEGFNVSGVGTLLVKIDPEYDTEVGDLDLHIFQTADVFIEGRSWAVDHRSGLTAFLISITPNQ